MNSLRLTDEKLVKKSSRSVGLQALCLMGGRFAFLFYRELFFYKLGRVFVFKDSY